MLTNEQKRLVLDYCKPDGFIFERAGKIAQALGLTTSYVSEFVKSYNKGEEQ